MLQKLILSVMLLPLAWTVSSAQSSKDSLCYSIEEARTIATKLLEGSRCEELLTVGEMESQAYQNKIAVMESIEKGLLEELSIERQVVQLHMNDVKALESEVKRYKKRNVVTIVLASIVCGFTLFIAVK